MKIDYISAAFFSDVDVSFISELQKYADVNYYVFTGSGVRGSAVYVNSILKPGIYSATEMPQLSYLAKLLDLSHVKIVHRSNEKHSFFSSLFVTLRLCYIILKENPDVVHLTFILRHFEWPLYMFKKKLILSVHDPLEHSSTSSKAMRIYRRLAFNCARMFIIFNHSQRDVFIKKYHLDDSQVINSKLSTYTFLLNIGDDLDIRSKICSKQYILFFGTITRYKGLDILLEAMKIVHRIQPHLELVVAGGGNIYFPIEEYLRLDYITILNRYIQNSELATLIKNCSFVVCPYRDATQSGVIMSSFALGKPVIATNVGGLSEMVLDGYNGTIIPANDVDALSDAIINLYINKKKIHEMSANILNDYTNGENSWQYIVKELWDLLYSKRFIGK